MARPLLLAIDQGTTSTRAIVYDDRLVERGSAQRDLPVKFPKEGWVEQKLDDIWEGVEWCIAKALSNASVKGRAISAVGIVNQRETTGLWRRSNRRPVGRAIVWQDRRTAAQCAAMKSEGLEPLIRERTGLVLDPYFSALKLAWLLDHGKDARAAAERGELAFGTVDTWVLANATGGAAHCIEASNASRTSLLNLATLQWDEELLQRFGIPASVLPEVVSSAGVAGTTRGMRSLPDGIPIAGIAGDQQAALFGQGCFAPGDAKCTYGTGAFLLMNVGTTPVASQAGLLSTVAWRLGSTTTYALEGSAFVAGAAIQWLRDGLGLIRRSRDVEKLARKVPDAGGVVFVPALAGLGAPHWRPEARGLFHGLTRATTAAHLGRAVLEGLAWQVVDLIDAMGMDAERKLAALRVDGGAADNDLLMQLQANFLGMPVQRPRSLECTSRGAAMLAGLGLGLWESPEQIPSAFAKGRTFAPRLDASDRAAQQVRWRDAVSRA